MLLGTTNSLYKFTRNYHNTQKCQASELLLVQLPSPSILYFTMLMLPAHLFFSLKNKQFFSVWSLIDL